MINSSGSSPADQVVQVLAQVKCRVGHLLGGPEEDDRTTLAMACATRHAGVGILVAASYPGPVTAVLLLAYLLTSAVVTIPYLRWRRKSQPKQQGS